MKNFPEIEKAISESLNNRSLFVKPTKVGEQYEELIFDKEFSTYTINLDNGNNLTYLVSYAEESINMTLPLDFSEALKFLLEFEKKLKEPEPNVTWAGLIELRDALGGFILAKIHNETGHDLVDFALNLLEKKSIRKPHLRFIENYFFKALLHTDKNAKDLLNTIRAYKKTLVGHGYIGKLISYIRDLSKQKPTLSKALYNEIIGSDNWETEFEIFPAHILIGLYKYEPDYTFKIVKEQLESHPIHSIFILGRIDFSNESDFQEAVKVIEEAEMKNELESNSMIDVVYNILKSRFVNSSIVELCFHRLQSLFDLEVQAINQAIIFSLAHSIKNYEEERYKFILKNNAKFEIHDIEDCFSNFKNPFFFFNFFEIIYKATEGKLDQGIFQRTINHFWRTDQEKTEKFILDFLSHENLFWRKAGMYLLKNKDFGVF